MISTICSHADLLRNSETNFLNSGSESSFLFCTRKAASSPAVYLRLGFCDVTASSTTFATSTGKLPFCNMEFMRPWNCFMLLKYGELESRLFAGNIIPVSKLVLIAPGYIMTTLIPNGSRSYAIDSLRPSTANFVLIYGDSRGIAIFPPIELMFTMMPLFCSLMVGKTA